MNTRELPIEQIEVGFRYRKDLGDLRSLADSIAEVGLLHPVVVTPAGRLIAGQRRLGACRLLGWTEVPVTVVDLLQAARGEAHENFIRKDLLPSEIVALKRAVEPLEHREARQRQGSRADLCHPATVAEGQGDARDKIARYLGVGRTTIERAEAVVEAAEEEPEEYGHLVAQMDRSGKVAGAFRRLTVLKQAKELEAEPPEQGAFVKDDQVIHALAPNCPDDALNIGSLPGRARSRKHFLDAHGLYILPKTRRRKCRPGPTADSAGSGQTERPPVTVEPSTLWLGERSR
jgi:ParB family chromosome partitioning protein